MMPPNNLANEVSRNNNYITNYRGPCFPGHNIFGDSGGIRLKLVGNYSFENVQTHYTIYRH